MLRAVSGGGSSVPGSQTRFVSGIPSDSTGIDGDVAFSDNGYAYQRTGGAYVVQGQWIGSPGQPGTNASSGIILGYGAPDSSVGVAGQGFLDASNNLLYAPKAVSSVTPQGFWGVNIHIGYTSSYWPNMTAASYLALFAQMGVQTVRTNIASAAKATNVLPTIKALIAGGIDVLVVIDASPNLGSTFAAQQTAANTLGAAIANVLKGSGVVNIETSNEFDFNCKINGANPRGFVADGGSYDDFTSSKFECWRGWTSGMLAGIRSVTNEFKLGYASGVAFPQTAFRMLREGIDATGAVTQTPLAFDFLGAHFYDTESTNPLSYTVKSRTGSAQPVNSLAELRGLTGNATYDVPQTPPFDLYVTEWGSKAVDASQGTFINNAAATYFANKATYNIKAIYVYSLFADSTDSGTGPVFGVAATNYGIIQADGTTKKPAYTNYVNTCKTNTVSVPGGWPTIPRYLPFPPISYQTATANPDTAPENILRTEVIKGGVMGQNSVIRIHSWWSYPNNANTKTVRIRINGAILLLQSSFTTTGNFAAQSTFRNTGALNAQKYIGGGSFGWSTGSAAEAVAAVDTTQDITITFCAQRGTALDIITLDGYTIEIIG